MSGVATSTTAGPADGQQVGFIGWGPESAAMLEVLREWRPGIADTACVLSGTTERPAALRAAPSLEVLFRDAQVIFLEGGEAVLASHLPMIRLAISDRHRLVLLGGGWDMRALLEVLTERKLARCMLLPGHPATRRTLAYLISPYFTPGEREDFQSMFQGVDLAVELRDEAHFNVLQGLSEFAPAALYTVIEAMADGVVMMGFPRDAAQQYLAALLQGTAGRIMDPATPPGQLREQALSVDVAAAGLIEMESSGIRGIMMRAIRSAVRHRRHTTNTSNRERAETNESFPD